MKEKQVTLSYLEQARENWLTARDSAARADHMSARLNNLEAESMATIDRLLEELHALGGVAIQAAEAQ
jgi:hypothetical protein